MWLAAPALFLETGPFPVTAAGAGALVYLGLVGAAFTYAIWFRGLSRLDAGVVSALALLSPVCATLLGWLILGQALTVLQIGGLAMALSGVWLSQRRPKPQPVNEAGLEPRYLQTP
jgi:probable blue pigment (indigoidine) exporter